MITLKVIKDDRTVYFEQKFAKLDIGRLVKELNQAYWASAATGDKDKDEKEAADD